MDMPLPRHDDVSSMISVETAQERVLAAIEPLAPIELPLSEAFGCMLAEDVRTPIDLPPFASSAMDGFAVHASDVAGATAEDPVFLKVSGRALIGHPPDVTVGPGEAARIATGAPIPAGADCIVPVEATHATEDTVQVLEPSPQGRHIRPAAEDARSGEVVVPAGRKLGAPELGVLASSGFGRATVFPRPRVVVISTGDELVEPGRQLGLGQIYDSNAHTLVGALKEAGAQPFLGGSAKDDPAALREAVVSQLATADAFISSGGVSVGERDPVKAAFRDRGDIDFFRVAMQPGMPQAFGVIEGKPFFGLPGNPVSVFVSFEVFIRPALMKMMARSQLHRPEITARLAEGIEGPREKTVFARVLVQRGVEGWLATPTGGRGSNLLGTVARANGLAILEPGVSSLAAGDDCPVLVFRSLED